MRTTEGMQSSTVMDKGNVCKIMADVNARSELKNSKARIMHTLPTNVHRLVVLRTHQVELLFTTEEQRYKWVLWGF